MGFFSLFQPNIKTMAEKKDIIGLINVLKKTTNDKRAAAVMSEAIVALAQIGKPAVEPIYSAIRNAIKDKSFKDGIEGFAQVIEFQTKLWWSLAFLGIMTGETVIDDFIRTLKNKKEYNGLRGYIAMALGLIAKDRLIDPLIEILKDKTEGFSNVRGDVLRGLAIMQEQENRIKILASVLSHVKEETIVNKITSTISSFRGSKRILKTFTEIVNDKDEKDDDLKKKAAKALLGKLVEC